MKVRSSNLFGGTASNFEYNGRLGPYGNWGKLANGTYTISIALKDGVESLPQDGGYYFGISTDGATATNGVYWLVQAGVITHASYTFTAADSATKYVTYYAPSKVADFLGKVNIMLVIGSTAKPYQPYFAEVKALYYGVKPGHKIVLDGSEDWELYKHSNSHDSFTGMTLDFPNDDSLGEGEYSNYFGFYFGPAQNGDGTFYIRSNTRKIYLTWNVESPPKNYPHWITEDANGNKVADMEAIKADLRKRPLVAYYNDGTIYSPTKLSLLLQVIRREVTAAYKGSKEIYNNFYAHIIDNNTLYIKGEATNNTLTLDSTKVSVVGSTLRFGKSGPSTPASVEDGVLCVSGDVDNNTLALAGSVDNNELIL